MRSINTLWMVVVLGVLSMFQATVTGLFSIYGVKPDLVLLVVIIWALIFGGKSALVWAFVGGVWLDLFSGGPMGASSLALMCTALIGGAGYRVLSRQNALVPILLVIAGSLTFSLTYLVILQLLDAMNLFAGGLNFWSSVENIVLPTTLYNTTLLLLLLPFLNRTPERPESLLS